MPDLTDARLRMVDRQLAGRGIDDPYVLDAMREVPREAFVTPGLEAFAYEDVPLPIEGGQTISQPYVVGLMIQAAAIRPGGRVLEVGAGSGYAAAVMSRIAAKVFAIERDEDLAKLAAERLGRLGRANVEVRCADGTLGWPEAAPFDSIVVSAGGPAVPRTFREQLDVGGRLVMPVGGRGGQKLVKLVRTGVRSYRKEDLGGVAFVPLVGRHGWRSGAADAPQEPRSFRSTAAAPTRAPR